MIAISFYCYMIKYRAKQKIFITISNNELKKFCVDNMLWKMEIKMNFKKIILKIIYSSIYFDDTIKIADFDPDSIIIDKKSHENV